MRVRIRDHHHPGRLRRPDPVRPSPRPRRTASARHRAAAPPPGRRPGWASRAAPPPTTPSPTKHSAMPAVSSTASISGRFEDDATASGYDAASARTASTAPSSSGSSRVIALEHAPHDLGVDLVRLLRQPELVVHVARPLGRAHSHHRPLRLGRSSARPSRRRAPRAPRPRPARSRRSPRPCRRPPRRPCGRS